MASIFTLDTLRLRDSCYYLFTVFISMWAKLDRIVSKLCIWSPRTLEIADECV